MRITRKQIRKMILEERRRIIPISYYTDDELINEGLMDFLKGLWGKASEFFSGTVEKVSERFSELIAAASGEKVSSAAESEGVPDVESMSDLRPQENEQHKKVFFKSISETFVKALNKIAKDLESTKTVKNWTPKSNSAKDLKSWMEANKKDSAGLWNTVGGIKSLIETLEKSGEDMNVKIPEKDLNPANAIKFVLEACKSMKEVWKDVAAEGLTEESKAVMSAVSKVETSANAVAKAIADSAKTQKKEWVTLRRMVNAHVIQERKTHKY